MCPHFRDELIHIYNFKVAEERFFLHFKNSIDGACNCDTKQCALWFQIIRYTYRALNTVASVVCISSYAHKDLMETVSSF